MSAIVFVIKNALRWRDAQAEYGRHKTIYNRFVRWSRLGVFNKIFAALAHKSRKPEPVMIDATHLKAHRTAASLLKEGLFPDVSGARRAVKPATKVCVFQCPNGAFERSLWPFGLPPRRRVILVVVPGLVHEDQSVRLKPHVRSANAGPFFARLFDLGTVVLAGAQSFFEAIAGANEPTRQRSGISLLADRRGELGRQFRHGDVALLGNLRQKKRPMRFGLGALWTVG